ncbi:MAG TPA: aspartate ammonia-lyase [Anaerolinea thermolimosa]|uniref:Aspartate ammonia-lyase n=1 Tax=Anaerolinea thermolimosa TaxID=229919 RepID=A0A3D1JHT1_9CHLR|nr:aspartate ammonia-lyase [Anaerolinea thermolimosa]GAP07021.1 aspartate ammonia-lyase [Anaerolinea thermolimosa]HCE18131.1 aspartate ammonia-lyase [Anaerolinea thermolimosa]
MNSETAPFRVERDSLGEVRVPQNALWGAQTQRAVENFPISGIRPWRAWIWSVAVIKRAAAEVNSELGLLDRPLAQAIARAADEVMEGQWDDQFVVDPFQAGAGTSHNMNVNEVIATLASRLLGGAPVHPNDHVNMSQSTNDVIPTAIRLGALWRLDELLNAVEDLASALNDKATAFDDVIKSGRTHLQDAVPIRLGQEFSGYARAVKRDAGRIRRAAEGLRRLGIGGTAVGTGLNAHPEYHPRMVNRLSLLTGFRLEESDNLFESMQSMADVADFSASLRTLAITLTRIANDFRLLASGPATGLDEIRLPAVQPGSSIMPGKVNPVMAEMLNMAMFHIQGCDLTISLAAQAGQFELNVMMPIIAHNLFEAMQISIGSIRAFTDKCVRGLLANRLKAEGWLARNAILVTALNPLIGYSAGAALVKEASNRNLTILEVALEKAHRGELRHRDTGIPVSEDQIQNALSNLRRLTEGGIISSGGIG